MNHEEKTTELELPSSAPAEKNNIVHVNFAAKVDNRRPSTGQRTESTTPIPPPVPMPFPQPEPPRPWMTDFDPRSPWVMRLLAVLFVLILSMLIL